MDLFSEASLNEAAARGGHYTCQSCGAKAAFLMYDVAGPHGDVWELRYCPAAECRSNPLRKRMEKPQPKTVDGQPSLPMEV